jgi:hypothetical protein
MGQVEPLADLPVGQSVRNQLCDLQFLRREPVLGTLGSALAVLP